MFYLVMVPVTLFLLYQIRAMKQTQKHDVHLYRFCQLRRDIIDYVYKNHEALSREDYVDLRRIIKTLNIIIKNYQTHKTVIFNFREFAKHLRVVKQFEDRADQIKTKNPDVVGFLDKAQYTMCCAFLAYTPLLKSEIIVKLMMHLMKFGIKAGSKSLQHYVNKLQEAQDFINDSRMLTA